MFLRFLSIEQKIMIDVRQIDKLCNALSVFKVKAMKYYYSFMLHFIVGMSFYLNYNKCFIP